MTAPLVAATARSVRLPRRLRADAPGWVRRADVVVVGSGVAGLTAALHARATGARVLLVTKALVDEGSTRWAQGGIAAALDPLDSPDEHLRDTIVAGAGLCDEDAVRVLVTEGPHRVHELAALGAAFDLDPAGGLALTREGGHLRDRIVHAGGDATGAEVERALVAAVVGQPRLAGNAGIEVIEHASVLDLLLGPEGQVAGLTLHVLGEGTRDGVGAVHARAVVLASGGFGQVFASTTNPAVATGDGLALALRAGAEVADLEFVQFHPTVLFLGAGSTGQQPLLSEALRGEGARIVDAAGAFVLDGVHPLGDLAPRDVVAKAMMRRMLATGADHLYLDARAIPGIETRFPTIVARCRELGFEPLRELLPIAPAAHFASGGVRTGLDGATSVAGLYACGEVACTGVHGANRLASNSLLEGLVFASRIGDDIAGGLSPQSVPQIDDRAAGLLDPAARSAIAAAMTRGAGVLRSGGSLRATAAELAEIPTDHDGASNDAWETTNLHTVASALVAGALARTETRGSHWREEHDGPVSSWERHLTTRLDDVLEVR
jgi:L-aspartate oxidase